ncbi:MAG: hypothetical protein A2147_11230 [Chloroflexi bacterium RBG_16_57_8]|nr:MAG: hypothetical protein A2147_11230 [Chloroflexi bacterium RBG_16_57_8]
MDDVADIRKMYDEHWDKEDIRLERHQLERDITVRYLGKYLPPKGRILEIGAATGFYTLHLARRGYDVLATDLSPAMVSGLEKRVAEAGLGGCVRCEARDARDLSGISENAFDAVLLMGPLYHLVEKEDRLLALRQAFACLKSAGVLFSAFVSRFGILGDLVSGMPRCIHAGKELDFLVEHGFDTPDYPENVNAATGLKGAFRGYFATVQEIAPLHAEAGFETLAVAGVEPAISADDESYNRLEGETRRLWLDLLSKISTEPSMVASSRHMLYVGRRPGA